jgi:large subunit ribosomal protein L15
MPFRVRPKPKNNEWKCNDDPRILNAMYIRLLGEGGDKMLSDDVKWLAVTHKSFDQGKRGFNDRLAYFGKRIVEMQISTAIANQPRPVWQNGEEDEFGREPFEHPALEGLLNLTAPMKANLLDKRRLYELSVKYGLPRVLRWRPKKVCWGSIVL